MGGDNNSNLSTQFNHDGDQNRIVQQLLRTNISGERKQLCWYDIRNFPDSLLIEIVARLPISSIFRFKSVCKHWQTLISHPSFCQFYYSILNSNAAASSRPLRFVRKYTYVANLKEFLNRLCHGIQSSSEFSVLFLFSRKGLEWHRYDQFRVLDMSNGLILCCSLPSTPFVYYICDPLTRQWITLPTMKPQFQGYIAGGLFTRVNKDHVLTGYTVVRVDLSNSESNYLELEMFSSEKGKWIRYKLPCDIPIKWGQLRSDPIHCYGALHWLVCYPGNYGIKDHAMIAFDPYKDPKSVRLIPLPEDRDLMSEDQHLGSLQLCGECQGTLRYFEVAEDPTDLYLFTMWAMKDYEKGEWCCEFKVRRSDLHSTDLELSKWLLMDGYFHPLSFHPSNPNVVYLTCMEPEFIVSYDIPNRSLEIACKPIDNVEPISKWPTLPFVFKMAGPFFSFITNIHLGFSEMQG